jgi:hypothetical protein
MPFSSQYLTKQLSYRETPCFSQHPCLLTKIVQLERNFPCYARCDSFQNVAFKLQAPPVLPLAEVTVSWVIMHNVYWLSAAKQPNTCH